MKEVIMIGHGCIAKKSDLPEQEHYYGLVEAVVEHDANGLVKQGSLATTSWST